jgi:microcystin-dependent protein
MIKTKLSTTATTLMATATLTAGLGFAPAATASEPFLGQIMQVGFNFAPRGWALCDGQLLPISSKSALFSLLGTTFGGDGRTTFGLPDLRGRVAVHVGNGPGLSNVNWGQRSGVENVTLTQANMPSHTHTATATATATLNATDTNGNETGPTNRILANDPRENQYSDAAPNVTMNASSITVNITDVTVGNTGGSQAFNIRNPYLGIYHIIALQGLFPSRS